MMPMKYCTHPIFFSPERSVQALHLSLTSAFCAQGSCANYKLSGARGAQHQRLRGIKGLVGEGEKVKEGIKALILLCL